MTEFEHDSHCYQVIYTSESPSSSSTSTVAWENQCAVCLDAISDSVTCYPCYHRFCRICIHLVTHNDRLHKYSWSRAVPCPKCRQLVMWTEQTIKDKKKYSSAADSCEVAKPQLQMPGRQINKYLPAQIIYALEYCHSQRDSLTLAVSCVVLLITSILIAAQVSGSFVHTESFQIAFRALAPAICTLFAVLIAIMVVFVW